jgi:choline-sulfatase
VWRVLTVPRGLNARVLRSPNRPEADEAIKRFEKWSRADEPFFLYYNFSPPHMPLCDAPRKYTDMYDPEEVPLRPNVNVENYFPDLEFSTRVYRWDYRYYDLRLPYTEEVPDGYGIRGITAHYLGLITWIDDTLGRLVESLEANGLVDDTIIVFSADHGDNLGSHGRSGKGLPYEESINVPMLYSWPKGLTAKVEPERVASIVDIPATLLGLIGAETPEHMQGKDLSGLLRNTIVGEDAPTNAETARRTRFPWMEHGMTICELGRSGNVLVRSETMTAHFSATGEAINVFDNKADPYQTSNLAGNPDRADETERLRQMAAEYRESIPMMDEPDYDVRINWGRVPESEVDKFLKGRSKA